ncbi:zinc finger protein 10 [Punica granatum]|uniref:C2H2-type domain-containing protein n=2 Tax=Punica granatum TaxID=22663 RepID=A0A218XA31_PUNGR|nr:zinc finger protein 10 [Punica granatum]OWM81793.1 hypothetical protein CDL15_Pgr007831 [Punica granatum]PKI43446.1 hypothetical protein CRG98_036203 [Punica granatum]
MEQPQFLLWTKRRHNLSSHLKLGNNTSSHDDSWEEQAFAEDASGPLGGCIWPPRSYSCSFCRREFRSAQALGGHMNVHRRDRARLKQSGGEILNSHEHQNQPNQIQGPFVPLGLPYPSQAYATALSHKPNPNCDYSPFVSSTSSTSRVSAPPSEASCNEQTSKIPSYSSFLVNENCTKSPIHSPQSKPQTVSHRYRHPMNAIIGEKNPRIIKQRGMDKEDPGKTDLAVSWNLVIRTRPNPLDDEIEESRSCKKRRTDESSLLPFFMKTIAVDRNHCQEPCAFSSSPGEDLDLELRLGDRPKVKLQS